MVHLFNKSGVPLASPKEFERPDCTHYCTPGSVVRFWTVAALSWLSGMKD